MKSNLTRMKTPGKPSMIRVVNTYLLVLNWGNIRKATVPVSEEDTPRSDFHIIYEKNTLSQIVIEYHSHEESNDIHMTLSAISTSISTMIIIDYYWDPSSVPYVYPLSIHVMCVCMYNMYVSYRISYWILC